MRSLRRLICLSGFVLLTSATFSLAGSVGAVRSRVMQAQEMADHGNKDDALAKLKEAEGFLDGLTDDEKAPLVKSIAELRGKLGDGAAGAAKTGDAPAAANNTPAASNVDPEVAGTIQRNIERYINFAEGDADSDREGAAQKASQAMDALNADDAKKNLSPELRAKLQTRIETLQAKLNSAKTSEESRRYADRVASSIRAGNDAASYDTRFSRTRLDEAADFLASDEAKQKLDAPTMQKLQESLAAAETTLAAAKKKTALSRAEPPMKELEEKLASDPYKGIEPISAYQVGDEVQALRSRVTAEMRDLPAKDADRVAMEKRLAAAQTKMDGYDANFASANADLAVSNRWKYISDSFAGWDQENFKPGKQIFEKPVLDKTQKAASESKYFLAEKETAAARSNAANLPKATAAIADAEKIQSDALAKLDAAFNQWMDAAEKPSHPQGQDRFYITAASEMGRWADDVLAGSKYHDADVTRAKKLDQKWQDELAAIKAQHEANLKQMTAAATDAWPKIESSISSQDGFKPSDVNSLKGKTFRFKHIRNRSGWDFDGRYDLVMWVDGQPVAGNYAPPIGKAFHDASVQIGDSVDDHIDWDVIATIEGTGIANQRFSDEVKDEHMNVLGKVEGTQPVPCVVVRIIAVHAGPVAAKAE